MNWTDLAVRGIVATLIALAGLFILRAARNAGKTEAELRDQLAGEKTKAEIVEKSNESAEAAAARSDPSLHNVPDIVHGHTLPDWSKR